MNHKTHGKVHPNRAGKDRIRSLFFCLGGVAYKPIFTLPYLRVWHSYGSLRIVVEKIIIFNPQLRMLRKPEKENLNHEQYRVHSITESSLFGYTGHHYEMYEPDHRPVVLE